MKLDVLVFGGGVAGLWLLDTLRRQGYAALLIERAALGAGQSITSQGILHGGIKYALGGSLTRSARAIREMPGLWRDCLAGRAEPHLRATLVLSERCCLWRTESVRAKLGMVGARVGLRSGVASIPPGEVPAALAECPGEVFAVEEPVIDVASLLRDLARANSGRMVRSGEAASVRCVTSSPGRIEAVVLGGADGERAVEVRPRWVVLTAGAGNEMLRKRMGLAGQVMQRRPLHMVMVRGELPALYGHCVDGARTRVTITTAVDSAGRNVWNVGGQIAEDGVNMDAAALIDHAKRELRSVLPGLRLDRMEWAAYRIDRAEGRTVGGARPHGPTIGKEGNVITAWPTKLVLAPELARSVVGELDGPQCGRAEEAVLPDWPRPQVALPPWETAREWRV